jgi:hypothetical protein
MAPSFENGPAAGSRCTRCGQPASVTVVSEDELGERQVREFCLECAETQPQPRPKTGWALLALAPSMLIRGGALLALLALVADELGIRGKHGFGWRQIAGGEAGALVLVLGAFLRSGWLTISGVALLILSLGADHLRVGRTPGTGWRELLALAVGIAAVGIGLFWQRRLRSIVPRADRAEEN